jgi:hypothetical protein
VTRAVLRRRPGSAHLIALLALFVALGGSAYAVGANTIGSTQIRDGSVRSADIKDGDLAGTDIRKAGIRASDVKDEDLTGKDIADNSLAGADMAPDALTGADIDESKLAIPTAWANVSRNGAVQNGKRMTSADVTKRLEGVYCIGDVGGATAQVSAGFTSVGVAGALVGDAEQLALIGMTFTDVGCPTDTTWLVATYDVADGGGSADAAFNVAFYD